MWESKHELFAPFAKRNAKTPDGREDALSSAVLLPLAGLLSALLSAGLENSIGFLVGGAFGTIIGIALVMTKMLQGAWKVILLIFQTAIAYLFAHIATILIQGFIIHAFLGSPSKTSPVAIFAGGVVGGFIVLAVFSTMARYPEVGIQTLMVKSLAWSPVGEENGNVAQGRGSPSCIIPLVILTSILQQRSLTNANLEDRWLTPRLAKLGLDEVGVGWHAIRRYREGVASWQAMPGGHRQFLDGPQTEDDVGNLLTSPRGNRTSTRGGRAGRFWFRPSEGRSCSKCSEISRSEIGG